MRHHLRISAASVPVATGGGQRPCGTGRPSSQGRRRGFTLVELLVVISIIAILAALTVRVAVGLVNEGREAGTKATISKIQRILDTRLQSFQRKYGNNDPTTQVRLKRTPEWELAGVLLTQGQTSIDPNTQLIATRKLLYIQHFPQVAWELNSRQHPGMFTDLANPPTESNVNNAEVLYDLIMNATPLGDPPVGDDTFSTSEIADTDNDGLPEFIDAWGQPLRFYRWPVLLFRPDLPNSAVVQPYNPGNPPPLPRATLAMHLLASYPPDGMQTGESNQLVRDPQDPLAIMTRLDELVSGKHVLLALSGIKNWNPNAVPGIPRRFGFAGFHYPQTFHTPMVISAGADGDFGLLEPRYGGTAEPALDTSDAGFGFLGRLSSADGTGLFDNISSLRIRAGGK